MPVRPRTSCTPTIADSRRCSTHGIGLVDGMLADLARSLQLDAPDRGFSFRRDEPLDMRMDTSSGMTAAEMLASVEEKALADLIYELGEERHAPRGTRDRGSAKDAAHRVDRAVGGHREAGDSA